MYLKSLELQGFKSFPDRTLIRFGDEITAIVGPNGSGKSNISDALLWVMGEQSSRTLRGAKMEDVIFGGTQKRSPVGYAEATLTLDNADRSLAYDADEVVVTRRYYRSGEGEYYINRQSARLKDINELLMDTGLGREGYSNIGQGRIDEILSLKSGDRREIFEEAAGISKYRHRKEETERRLLQTEDNLLRIGDKVSELEIQLEPLKQQSEKAARYLELKKELKGVEVAVWLESLKKLSAAAKKAEEDYASAAFVLQQAKDDLELLYAGAERLGAVLREKDAELEQVRQQDQQLQNAHQQMEGQMAVLRGNKENNSSNLSRIKEELANQEQRSGGLSQQIEQAEHQVADLGTAVRQKEDRIRELSASMAAMTANAEGRTAQFLELRGRESQLQAKIAGCQADLRALEAAIAENTERLEQLEQDLSQGASRRESAEAALKDCQMQLASVSAQVTAARNTISGYQLRRSGRARRTEEISARERELRSKLDSVTAKLRVFRAMERDYESFQKSVRMVMQEAERGRLQHIHGPLSRLIRTQDDYTVAIEIALGSGMQEIVVDSESDGKAGIQFLKRTNGGRATFLPLSTARGGKIYEPALDQCRGYVGIASELVSCEDRYRSAVESRLGRTVVTEDLDAAIEISRRFHQKYRIVTLDGQVMNTGGSMTGGSTNRESGILSRANELEKLSAEEKQLSLQLQTVTAEASECKRQLDQADFEITAAQDDLRRQEDHVLLLQGQEKQHHILADAIREAEASAQREKQSLEARCSSDARRQAARQASAEAAANQLQQVRDKLAGLEDTQTEAVKASSRLNEDISAVRAEAAALEAERNAAANHIEDLRQLRASLEGDRERQRILIASIEEDSMRLDGEIAALQSRQQANAAESSRMQEKLSEAIAARAETEAARTLSERQAQEKNKDILNQERACALLEQKKLSASMEEKQIIDKLWENYELTPGTAGEYKADIESVAAGSRRIGELKRKLASLGTPNIGAIEEYARVSERYTYLTAQRDDVLTSKRELESIIRDITRQMTGIFVEEFARIDHYFGQVFEEMFGGGKGKLLLEDPQNPLTCGIEIHVQPPGKQVKTITLLSGGEKAFVATALYFAILKVRPTPFCLLDEIDAALDDRNVERFAGYLHNLSKKTQFIVITHRRGTMEAANVLYGVTMQEQGVSKLLRLDLDQMTKLMGITE